MTETKKQKKLILIAEDDPSFRSIYKLKLTKEGYEVKIAENGNELIDIAKKTKPDLILCDLMMPEKDGFTALEELKSINSVKHVPVIIFSSLSQPEDKQKVKKLGAVDYFVKSDVTIGEVVEIIKKYIG